MSEMEIRDAFGFTKTKPIVFKERGEDGQTIKTLSVSSMKLIRSIRMERWARSPSRSKTAAN